MTKIQFAFAKKGGLFSLRRALYGNPFDEDKLRFRLFFQVHQPRNHFCNKMQVTKINCTKHNNLLI